MYFDADPVALIGVEGVVVVIDPNLALGCVGYQNVSIEPMAIPHLHLPQVKVSKCFVFYVQLQKIKLFLNH